MLDSMLEVLRKTHHWKQFIPLPDIDGAEGEIRTRELLRDFPVVIGNNDTSGT